MDAFEPQIARIRRKLDEARAADPEFEVFGASRHRYALGPPVAIEVIRDFETRAGVALPEDYVAFLTRVGHGPSEHWRLSAGPFYGLEPIPKELHAGYLEGLAQAPLISPHMTDAEWEASDGRMMFWTWTDADAAAPSDPLAAGLLCIGDQGCQSFTGLMLTGPYRGRVVNANDDGCKPRFAFEANFLDWYERWLDEVIAGLLGPDRHGWFGFLMGGDEAHLMGVFEASGDPQEQSDALEGLLRLREVSEDTCARLAEVCSAAEYPLDWVALAGLARFDLARAAPHLRRYVAMDDAKLRALCHLVSREGGDDAIAEPLVARLSSIADPVTFAAALRVLARAGMVDPAEIAPFLGHDDPGFRRAAGYQLGKTPAKERLLPQFLAALEDPEPQVVHAAVQALDGCRAPELIPAYRKVAARFPDETAHIRANLGHRVKDLGYASLEAFERGARPSVWPRIAAWLR